MTTERDKIVADAINRGECPFGELKAGQSIAHCPLGFPGCGCADEMVINPLLKDLFFERLNEELKRREANENRTR